MMFYCLGFDSENLLSFSIIVNFWLSSVYENKNDVLEAG